MMRRALLCLALALAPAVGVAATPDEVAKARELSRAGAEAFRAEDYEKALGHFREANRLVPHPNLDVNIGRCYEALQQPDQALVHCKIALNAPGVPASTRTAAQQCVDRVTTALARPILELKTTPPGATLRIDGRLLGKTPWRGGVEPGRRQLDIELEGYEPKSSVLNAERGKTYPLAEALTPAAVGGLLSVSSLPPGAAVTLDGELVGTTPVRGFQLAARSYVLEVSLAGYAAHTTPLTLADGEHIERTITLVPLDGVGPGVARPKWPAWALMGAGAAAVGVGAFFGVEALGARQDADELARTSSDPADRARYDQLVSDMEGQQVTADVLILSGSAAVVGGLTWLLWPE